VVKAGLVCDVRREPQAVVIVARGELDMDTTGVLEKAFEQAIDPVPARVVLDFSR
jgi:hypothetical protein